MHHVVQTVVLTRLHDSSCLHGVYPIDFEDLVQMLNPGIPLGQLATPPIIHHEFRSMAVIHLHGSTCTAHCAIKFDDWLLGADAGPGYPAGAAGSQKSQDA